MDNNKSKYWLAVTGATKSYAESHNLSVSATLNLFKKYKLIEYLMANESNLQPELLLETINDFMKDKPINEFLEIDTTSLEEDKKEFEIKIPGYWFVVSSLIILLVGYFSFTSYSAINYYLIKHNPINLNEIFQIIVISLLIGGFLGKALKDSLSKIKVYNNFLKINKDTFYYNEIQNIYYKNEFSNRYSQYATNANATNATKNYIAKEHYLYITDFHKTHQYFVGQFSKKKLENLITFTQNKLNLK